MNAFCHTVPTTGTASAKSLPTFHPKSDIVETKNGLEVSLEVPGLAKDEIEIKLEKNRLTLKGKVKAPEGELWYSEYAVGDFERSFALSDNIDKDSIEASLEKGVLTLKLAKKPEMAPKSIEVH